ncbi:MAG TPA: FAD-dependent monooxygenase, partial [Luteimonas sp.]|nr:FAD-dependent monooxygenase [Luteimonas sp.]
ADADADADADAGWRTLRIVDAGGPRQVRTRLLVGADGTRSDVRTALGITAEEHDYRQTLLVARVRPARVPDGTAYERLRHDGPTALLPRGDRQYGLVHTVARDEAQAVLALDDAAFLARAQAACGWRAGRLLSVGPRSAYPALRLVAARTTAPRAAIVGNAAQTVHPVGAQGFNLGMRDAMTLAELLLARASGDPGDPALLAAYALRRAEDRARTIAFSDGLVRVASRRTALPAPLRSLGLFALDTVSVLQGPLASGAMGYRGEVPALCRTASP